MIDFTCTSQMTNERSKFSSFEARESHRQVGKSQFVRSGGRGTLQLQETGMGSKSMLTLRNVLYATELLYTRFSISMVRQSGIRVSIEDVESDETRGALNLIEKNRTVIKLAGPEPKQGLYEVAPTIVKESL